MENRNLRWTDRSVRPPAEALFLKTGFERMKSEMKLKFLRISVFSAFYRVP